VDIEKRLCKCVELGSKLERYFSSLKNSLIQKDKEGTKLDINAVKNTLQKTTEITNITTFFAQEILEEIEYLVKAGDYDKSLKKVDEARRIFSIQLDLCIEPGKGEHIT